MSNRIPEANVDRLQGYLDSTCGDSVRSVVKYSPESETIYYLRSGIDESTARDRLIRVNELYHSERLSSDPSRSDPAFGRLCASVHVFESALVCHVVQPGGTVYGVSFDHDVGVPLRSLVEGCIEALYGEVPDCFTLDWS